MDPMPGWRNGQAWRITSPSGGSTLITSAPKSPRICVANGPITTVVRSRTRTPLRGPPILFRLPAGESGEPRPVRDLRLDAFAELGRAHRRDVGARVGEALLHLGLLQRLQVRFIQLLHDRRR